VHVIPLNLGIPRLPDVVRVTEELSGNSKEINHDDEDGCIFIRFYFPGLAFERVESRETLDVFWSWSNRVRGSSEVALVESPDLI